MFKSSIIPLREEFFLQKKFSIDQELELDKQFSLQNQQKELFENKLYYNIEFVEERVIVYKKTSPIFQKLDKNLTRLMSKILELKILNKKQIVTFSVTKYFDYAFYTEIHSATITSNIIKKLLKINAITYSKLLAIYKTYFRCLYPKEVEKKLKILVINCTKTRDNSYIQEVNQFLNKFGSIKTVLYNEFIHVINELFKFDLLILTGGDCNFYREDFYEKEHKILRNTTIPIIGFCQGLQILAKIFCNAYHYKIKIPRVKGEEFIYDTFLKGILCYYHSWAIKTDDINEDFNVVDSMNLVMNTQNTDNTQGPVYPESLDETSIVLTLEHKQKKIIAFQGHPELSESFGESIMNIILSKWF